MHSYFVLFFIFVIMTTKWYSNTDRDGACASHVNQIAINDLAQFKQFGTTVFNLYTPKAFVLVCQYPFYQ